MGCYEIIKDALFCPFCGKQQEECEFQSKDIGDMMNTWTIEKIKKLFPKSAKLEIYSQRMYCKEWISINLDLRRMKNGLLSSRSIHIRLVCQPDYLLRSERHLERP